MTTKSPSARPSAAEFGMLRAALAQAGVSQSEINKAIGSAVNGRSRRQITASLLAWLALLSRPVDAQNGS